MPAKQQGKSFEGDVSKKNNTGVWIRTPTRVISNITKEATRSEALSARHSSYYIPAIQQT
jgi:hypothetical protein